LLFGFVYFGFSSHSSVKPDLDVEHERHREEVVKEKEIWQRKLFEVVFYLIKSMRKQNDFCFSKVNRININLKNKYSSVKENKFFSN